MTNALKRFIIKIRNSEEPVRRRWLYFLTLLSMIITVWLWSVYVNQIVKPASSPAIAKEDQIKNPGLAQAFGTGLKTISKEIKQGGRAILEILGRKLGGSKIITIQKSARFSAENLETIPPTLLP